MRVRKNPIGQGFIHPVSSDITPEQVYTHRRQWLQNIAQSVAVGAAGLSLATWAQRGAAQTQGGSLPALPGTRSAVPGATLMERPTRVQDATTYNNFYEFGTDKSDPAQNEIGRAHV